MKYTRNKKKKKEGVDPEVPPGEEGTSSRVGRGKNSYSLKGSKKSSGVMEGFSRRSQWAPKSKEDKKLRKNSPHSRI